MFLQTVRLLLRINAYKIISYVRKQEIVLSNISHFISQKMFVILEKLLHGQDFFGLACTPHWKNYWCCHCCPYLLQEQVLL